MTNTRQTDFKDERAKAMLKRLIVTSLILTASTLSAPYAFAEPTPTADLLLPYFEVDLTGFQRTTLFTVTNDDPQRSVDVEIVVHTNWGIRMQEVQVVLEPKQTRGFNLRDWILVGELPQPDGTLAALAPQRLAHVQSALSGQQSPQDHMYYSTQVLPDMAVGYVTIRAKGANRDNVLWGNFYIIDPAEDAAQGDVLVDINPAHQCHDLCSLHLLFFLEGGVFDGGTEIIVWNPGQGLPQASAEAVVEVAGLNRVVRDLSGEVLFSDSQGLLATQTVTMEELITLVQSGSMELETVSPVGSSRTVDSFIGIRYGAEQRYSATLQSWCRPLRFNPPPPPPPPPGPRRIDIEKATNGLDADQPTGPQIEVGDPVTWSYVVTNTGQVTLFDISVTDDQEGPVSCPKSTLAPGESMTCDAIHGTAQQGQYANRADVTARDEDDREVRDSDPSHYLGVRDPDPIAIDIEKATNGHDADSAPGPQIQHGQPVTWSYVVTNTGQVTLLDVAVHDDREGAITCPKSTLQPGESMTCTAHGTAGNGQYANLAEVTGRDEDDRTARDEDPSHYNGVPRPISIDIEKATNGHDADSAPGPNIPTGDPVTWSYVVTNTGQATLFDVAVTDDQEGAISCPKSTLAPGEAMTCTAHGTAGNGQYANLGMVTGRDEDDRTVSDDDPSHYTNSPPPPIDIDIEKATNGHDADQPTGPEIQEGDAVTWTYVVTNTGEVTLFDVAVTDDQEGAISCPKSTLAPGEAMTCTAHGVAGIGQYANLGTVSGRDDLNRTATDEDPSHYNGTPIPPIGIHIEKATNGHDADQPTGPKILVGEPVTWTYVVTNTGDVTLFDVTVEDNQEGFITCPKDVLEPGESMTCTQDGVAGLGQYANVGMVTGQDDLDRTAADEDPSHYFGEPIDDGDEGCTPGYWKNHTDSWPPTGYSPGQSLPSVFAQSAAYPELAGASMLEALNFHGGGGADGAARNLMRAAVAALLDASHPGVDYPRTPVQVISQVNSALASGDRDTMLTVAGGLDRDNNLGCPLN